MEAAVVDFAHRLLRNLLLCKHVEGVVHHHVVNGERQFLLCREFAHLLRVVDACRNWLLDDDMLASLQRLDCDWGVVCVVCRDVNGVDVLVRQNCVDSRIPFEAERLSGRFSCGIHIKCANENGILQSLRETRFVAGKTFFRQTIFGNAAETNHCIPYFFHCWIPFFLVRGYLD